MQFIDTHSHLYDEAFADGMDLAVERAVQEGVTQIILPDIDSSSRKQMFDLAHRYPEHLYPCLGLHPTSIDADWRAALEKLDAFKNESIVAIGGIGIDRSWSKQKSYSTY